MAGMKLYQEQLPILNPHAFAALQKLVMAMADVANDTGKKTWFGKDKGTAAYDRFMSALKQTIIGMILDGNIKESSTVDEIVGALGDLLNKFSMAYPNWVDAYSFANAYFRPSQQEEYKSVINRLRSW